MAPAGPALNADGQECEDELVTDSDPDHLETQSNPDLDQTHSG
jgi:hypothetical protein